jgi:hypothetical protein
MDSRKPSSLNIQHVQAVPRTKSPNSPGDQSDETNTHEGIVQFEVDVLSVTNYRLYKRRWIGLGASP